MNFEIYCQILANLSKHSPNIYDKNRQILHYFFLFYVLHNAKGVL